MEINSRKKFAEEVARTIIKEHGQSKEGSFIFGISGKWGEGKSYFLDLLRDILGNRFKIISINPWKYASDRTTFLRHFIVQLKKVENEHLKKESKIDYKKILKYKKFKTKKNYILNKLKINFDQQINKIKEVEQIRKLEFDISEKSINKVRFWKIFLLLFVFTLIFTFYKKVVPANWLDHWFFSLLKNLSFIVGIPTMIAFASQMIISQQSSKALSTIDQFDNLLDKILNKLKSTKILVFVDDLDRVTPMVARDVLDNLRTFFDKKELSFVVTGDHSVLERYIGSQTLQNKNEGEHLEEGRRFLKKIFNYYWRLPLLIDYEFESFLDDEINKNENKIDEIFKDEKSILKKYLERYFEKNFRQVKRFLNSTLFTFKIIDLQLEKSNEENKKYFIEMKNNPILVTRILMIQDLCTPLFEEILKDFTILFELEYAAEKSNNEKIKEILDKFQSELSVSRKSFISKFLFETPRFFHNKSLTVSSLESFLHLAADTSLGDQRGPSAEDFKSLIQSTTDPSQIQQSIIAGGHQKVEQGAKATLELINSTSEAEQKKLYLKAVLNSLIKIPIEHHSQLIYLNTLFNVDLTQLIDNNQPDRLEIISLYWKWLDVQKSNTNLSKYIDKFPFRVADDVHSISLENFGRFSSQALTKWLCQYYSQNKNDAVQKMIDIFPKFKNSEVLQIELEKIIDLVSQDIITNEGGDELREKRIKILEEYSKEGISNLRTKVFNSIQQKNNEIWQWSQNLIIQGKKYWTANNLELQLIEAIKKVNSSQELVDFISFCNGKISILIDKFWNTIITEKFDLFFEKSSEIIINQSFSPLSPSKKESSLLFSNIINKMLSIPEDQVLQLLNILAPNNWVWKNPSKQMFKREIKKIQTRITDSSNDSVQELIKQW